MGNNVKATTLQNVVLFSLGATSLWSGRAKLRVEDLGSIGIDLPPEHVASLGSKRLISKDTIVKLEKVKRRMHRECAAIGTKFLNGYAVPSARAEDLAKSLSALVAEGDRLRQDLLDNFDSAINEWHKENPQWAHILRAGTPEKESIHKRITFGWDAFMVAAPEQPSMAARLMGSVSSLGSSLYDEIAAEANDFVKKSLGLGRQAGSQRTAAPVRRMVDKLRGLKFLDHRIEPLTEVFERIMRVIPATGKVEGEAYVGLVRVAYVLADVAEMHRFGEEVGNGKKIDDVVAEILGAEPSAAPVVSAATQTAQQAGADSVGVESLFEDAVAAVAGTASAAAQRPPKQPKPIGVPVPVAARTVPVDVDLPKVSGVTRASIVPPAPLVPEALVAAANQQRANCVALDF